GEIAAAFGRRAVLVTGRRALRDAGITDRLVESLHAAGVEATVAEEAEPEPGVRTRDRVRQILRRDGAEAVITAGGGTAIEVGKAAAALADEDAPTREYFSDRPVPAAGRPCVAVPTTAGTGAEVTPNSVLSDPARQIKQSIRGPAVLPVAAVVDAELTVPCPPDVTASAGMDALTQAVESYLSVKATPLTEALSLQSVRLIVPAIEAAHADGTDLPAREAMAYGSLLAGMALANARLGAVHGMAHPIGFRCHIPHGVVCAALLAPVLRFNREAAAEKWGVLCDILGPDPADAVTGLLERLALPAKLSGLGLREELLDVIAAESIPSGSLAANPRPVSVDEVKSLLRCVV
ncbi:MAG: iron-containing alcohol dehydrogenase family protein, partial [Planctomycetota bacterium]